MTDYVLSRVYFGLDVYRKISNVRRTESQNFNDSQYNIIFHTALRWLKQNINQYQITMYIPYLVPTGGLWGVFCEDLV